LHLTGQHLDRLRLTSIRIGQEGSGAAQIRCYGPNTSTNGSLTFKMSRSDGTNSQDVVIDGSGRLGIGDAFPGFKLEVASASGSSTVSQFSFTGGNSVYLKLANASNTQGFIGYETQDLTFYNNNTESLRIDSSGRLLVGTSTARSNFFNTASSAPQQLQVEGTTGNTCSLSSICSAADTSGGRLLLAHQRSGAVGGNTILNSGDQAGYITFQGNDGGQFVECASIDAQVDGTPGADDMPGRLVFSTTADGASSATERVRINAAGAFKASLAGTYDNATSTYHELRTNTSGDWIAYFTQTTASNPNGVVILVPFTTNSHAGPKTRLFCALKQIESRQRMS
jgi:hypothetical protein